MSVTKLRFFGRKLFREGTYSIHRGYDLKGVKMKRRTLLKTTIIFFGLVCLNGILLPYSWGQSYPSKTITMIVPHGVGGGGDVAARILGAGMQRNLGVNIVIKNITGGGNIIGLSALWRSKPDGYTIGMTYAQMASTSHIFEKVIYDPKKFSVFARFVNAKYIVAVPKNSPFRSFAEMRKSEKPIRIGASSVISNAAISTYALLKELKVPATFVSGYAGAAASIMGALKGEHDICVFGAVLKPYIERGDMVPLLFIGLEKSKEFPDVPILKDYGIPEYIEILGSLDYLVYGPPNVSEDKMKILEKAVLKATEENKNKFEDMWLFPSPLSGEKAKKRSLEVYDIFVKYGAMTKDVEKK